MATRRRASRGMTGEEMGSDLYGRLTSRKLWLCLITMGIAMFGYWSGNLTYNQLQTAILTAVGLFTAAEGLTDAASALQRRTAPDSVVNVDAQSPVIADRPMPAASAGMVRGATADEIVDAIERRMNLRHADPVVPVEQAARTAPPIRTGRGTE